MSAVVDLNDKTRVQATSLVSVKDGVAIMPGWQMASNGDIIYPDAGGAGNIVTDVSGYISSETFVDPVNGSTYKKTYSKPDSVTLNFTAWVKQ